MDEAGVANLALGRMGVSKAIASLADRANEAIVCNRFFEYCRQEVLRAFPWDFAQRAQALAEVADQTYPGYGFVYQYPDECLKVRAVSDENGIRYMNWPYQYDSTSVQSTWFLPQYRYPWTLAIKDDGASRVILTDIGSAWAFFTADVTNMGAWPPDAQGVLAWRLAMEIGGPLTVKRELVDAAEQRYSAWFKNATANALNESRDEVRADSPSITVRM